MATTFRRTKYLVDQGIQFRFARFVIAFVFLASVLTGLTIFFTTFMMMGEKLASVYPQGRLVPIFQSVYLSAALSLLAVMPFIFYGAIVFSHRIAGPLPKIYEALRQVGKGNFEVNLTLRKPDELVDLVNVINQMAKDLKERELKR